MTTPNTEELVAIYQHIKANPEEWKQGAWGVRNDCGTRFCVAGLAAVRAGATPIWEPDLMPDENGLDATWDLAGFTFKGEERGIVGLAQEVLGLTDARADSLFWGGNDLAEIRRVIERITGVDPESVTS